jgi:cyclic-di-AMP phosphodiesterase PgpH
MDTSTPGENDARAWSAPRLGNTPPWRTRIAVVLLSLLLIASVSVVLVVRVSPDAVDLSVGEAAPRAVLAPHTVTYVSRYLTDQQREQVAAQIAAVYSAPDAEIVRQQLAQTRGITDYLTQVRTDSFATLDERKAAIQAIRNLTLSPAAINAILSLDAASWEAVRADVNAVLEQAMRAEIRDTDLADAQRRVPTLVNHTLSPSSVETVVALVQALLVPNSTYDEAATTERRQQARDRVLPVNRTIKQGEAVVREGDLVTELDLEELQALGLQHAKGGTSRTAGTVMFVGLLVGVLVIYIYRLQPDLWERPRRLLLLALSFIVAAAVARLMVPGHTLLPYLFPAAALAMLASVLINVQLGVIMSLLLAGLVGFVSGGSLEMVMYALVGSLVGSLVLWQLDQLSSFTRAGAIVALANILTLAAFRVYQQDFDTAGLVQLLGMAIANGAVSVSLTFAAYAFVGRAFGITTALQLLELARPTHPLFRQLLLKAPGTYHHSIIVANMAERAAEVVGADPLLARVGAYYHDIGKTVRPYFFIENQSDGMNVHDRLDPKTSAQIIIRHTQDGVDLARQYDLPERVQDIIAQHHGTTMAGFFFRVATRLAKENKGPDVEESDFRYPGPKPNTREAAIVMLADVEAVVRSMRPDTPADMDKLIRQYVDDKLLSGQLDRCNLTLLDLDLIREAFSSVLKSIFHPRIQYPEEVK